MAANIAAFRALIRKDLHDEDSAAYRWTDAVLDRHIQRAVAEYSLHHPREQLDIATTVPGSREINISSLAGLLEIEAVEWPVGEFPPRRVGFSQWQTTLTMDVVNEPQTAENVNIYWLRSHLVDATTSSVEAIHDDIICAGAAAYAAFDWTSFASNRVNIGGEEVWGRYSAFAQERLTYFHDELRRIGRRAAVRVRRMYSTDAPSIFEQNRVKY
jgi:hypothetical protein